MKKVRGERDRTRLCKTDVNLQESGARERLYAPHHHGLFCLASIIFFQALCRVLEKERKKRMKETGIGGNRYHWLIETR
jgi:hypothetical protein